MLSLKKIHAWAQMKQALLIILNKSIIRLYFKLREVNQIDKKFDSKFNSAIGYSKSTKLLW